ncbi:MAG: RNase J family beta-CASP ribonuclease [Candidatus Pacearchaeota archaeon]
MFKVYTIGGYSEVGKNMTAIELGEDIIVFDCGLYMPAVVDLQETTKQPTAHLLNSVGAFPDDSFLEKNKHRVRAFLISHAHLDHVGAVQYIAKKYPEAEIFGTPFTIEVLKTLLEDTKTTLKNKITVINQDASCFIKGRNRKYRAEFISMTHSTLQTSIVALHTDSGIIAYAEDFKLDNTPILGNPPNYKRLKEIAKQGIKLLIVDSLYSSDDYKTPSEKIARALVEEVLLTVDNENRGIFVTTFSSHIARLKSIVEFSRKLNRKVIFVGRSLSKYVNAAKKIKMCPFEKDIELVSYTKQIESALKKVEKDRAKYVVVCTGHQGEPGSVLDRIASGKLQFNFKKGDSVIFSSKVIPIPINMSNRANMEKKLKKYDVRIFDHVHVSGHGGREDIRDLINLLKPKYIIPAHGSLDQISPAIELAREMGYELNKTAFLCQDGSKVVIN